MFRKERRASNTLTAICIYNISVETQQSSYNILFINKLFHAFNAIISMNGLRIIICIYMYMYVYICIYLNIFKGTVKEK